MRLNSFSKLSKASGEDEIIHYLNGIFFSLGLLNSFANDSKSLYVRAEEIKQGQKLRQTLKLLTHESYDFSITKLDSSSKFKSSLRETLPKYIEQQKVMFLHELSSLKHIKDPSFRMSERALAIIESKFVKLHDKPKVQQLVIELLNWLIKENDNIYAVQVNDEKDGSPWYEAYHDDYVIINKSRVIHIHLGGSD